MLLTLALKNAVPDHKTFDEINPEFEKEYIWEAIDNLTLHFRHHGWPPVYLEQGVEFHADIPTKAMANGLVKGFREKFKTFNRDWKQATADDAIVPANHFTVDRSKEGQIICEVSVFSVMNALEN